MPTSSLEKVPGVAGKDNTNCDRLSRREGAPTVSSGCGGGDGSGRGERLIGSEWGRKRNGNLEVVRSQDRVGIGIRFHRFLD
jgi:hypothetical protein